MILTPNYLAYAALLLWPIVALCLFATKPVSQALLWTILGGYLILPVGTELKLPGVPAFDKNSIPALVALFGCWIFARSPSVPTKRIGSAEVLLAALLVGPFITSEFNPDALLVGGIYGSFVLPGVGHYEALSASVAQLIVLIPFMLGRRYLGNLRDRGVVFSILTLAGLAYTLPMLVEVRLSPQLHTWIYGYFPSSFEQQIRDGGFRPVVFLGHGLKVAFFAMMAMLASAALWRSRRKILSLPAAASTAWLAGTLLLCKSLGSFVYAMVLTPVILLTSPRTQVRLAAALVSLALVYPMLRATDLFPSDALLNAASFVSSERQASMKVRFDQEKLLLAHVSERPWFGWGRFGRGRVYDESGKDISITDGHWIITMTTFGLFGFLAEFVLLSLPVFRSLRVVGRLPGKEQVFLASLALVVAVSLVDLLPNATINPFTWLLAGALLGQTEAIRVARTKHLPKVPPRLGAVPLNEELRAGR